MRDSEEQEKICKCLAAEAKLVEKKGNKNVVLLPERVDFHYGTMLLISSWAGRSLWNRTTTPVSDGLLNISEMG